MLRQFPGEKRVQAWRRGGQEAAGAGPLAEFSEGLNS